jgi:hypothetical protein
LERERGGERGERERKKTYIKAGENENFLYGQKEKENYH